jgi:hypothetical protein
MKKLPSLLAALLFAGTTFAIPETPPAKEENPAVPFEKGRVREIKVTLLDADDKPAAGVAVDLYGQDHGERWPEADPEPKKDPAPEKSKEKSSKTDRWWHFKTDEQGAFTVRFPVKADTWGEAAPRHGAFYLVVNLPDGHRAVSPRIFHGVTREESADYEVNEWDSEDGGDWVFTDETHDISMQLLDGRTVSGTVISPDGKPLSGKTVTVTHDLHVDSHTGAGGDIFVVKATTDAEGHFKLEHVYPVACRMDTGKEGAWTRTQLKLTTPTGTSTRWISQPLDRFPDIPDDFEVELSLVVAPQAPTYHYFGQVTDEAGKPMANVIVTAGVSHHAVPSDFADSHRFETATAGPDGRWTLEASAPWVRFLAVKQNEKAEDDLTAESYEDDSFDLAAPGEYNLVVRKAAPEAAPSTKPKEKEKEKETPAPVKTKEKEKEPSAPAKKSTKKS